MKTPTTSTESIKEVAQISSTVSLVKIENKYAPLEEGIAKALGLIDFKPKSSVNTVAIKVNLCYYWNASTGQTTDPLLVSALIDHIRTKYGKDVEIKVAEADASAMKTKIAFPLLGYTQLAQEKKVDLCNLSEDVVEEKKVQVNNYETTLKVPQTLINSDLLINMPKLKVMRATHITCAMKNIFGAIAYPRKVTYHSKLAETIVAINKLLKPNLNVVDGLIALGKYPIRLNLLMAGEQAFAIDWVAAQVMGYTPSRVRFLSLAIQEKLGDPKLITTVGEEPRVFREVFPKESALFSRVQMRLQMSILKTYSRLSGDIIPPSILED